MRKHTINSDRVLKTWEVHKYNWKPPFSATVALILYRFCRPNASENARKYGISARFFKAQEGLSATHVKSSQLSHECDKINRYW